MGIYSFPMFVFVYTYQQGALENRLKIIKGRVVFFEKPLKKSPP